MSLSRRHERQSRKSWRLPGNTLGWWLLTLLAFVMVIYSLGYLVLGQQMYPDVLADSFRARPWGIYTHAFFALFALGVGPFQFLGSSLRRRRAAHRMLGKIYVISALMTGVSGFYMAAYAYGGWISQFGFGGMSVATLLTTTVAYFHIRNRAITTHRSWMIRSYAVLFSAVTFRVWLLLLVIFFSGALLSAYQWASWLSWVINLAWAEWFIRRAKLYPKDGQRIEDVYTV